MAHRRRDLMAIIPLTLLAAAGATVWLDNRYILSWLVAVGAFVGLNQILGSWLPSKARATPFQEWLFAASTLVYSTVYGLLPFALIIHGDRTALVAGAAMLSAIALSSTAEFAISRAIGSASLISVGLIASVGAVWPGVAESPTKAAVAMVASLAFLAYVLVAAVNKASAQDRLLAALAIAREKEAEAAAANAAKTVFLATMSHEIRTPLNGVLGMVQVMQFDALTPTQRERLEIIRKSGESLTAILNDVLDLSKIEAGRLELSLAPFDLEDVLDSCHNMFAPLAEGKGLFQTLTIEAGASGLYQSDAMRLRQIVCNLLSNAVKFTARGEIQVVARYAQGVMTLSVQDSGPGIPPEHLAGLFTKFNQLDASTTRRHGGTGLGLAICHELCGLMGGEIAVVSKVGEGSIFSVTLPLQRLGDATPSPAKRSAPLEPERGQAPIRVLAAEDNPVNQMVLQAILRQAGVAVVMASDGAKAVEAWSLQPWDMILMDVHMPVMDGVAATEEIRRREASEGRPRTPIIALTANAMDHQVSALLAEGFDDHVGKPIDVTTLLEAMDRALRLRAIVPESH